MSISSNTSDKSCRLRKPLAVVALIFGVMTLFSGGAVLFGPEQTRELAGHYVGFVVWFNFLAGGVYIVAAIGLWSGKVWAWHLAAFIALATALVAFGFAIVVLRGNPFEMRTVGALILRFSVWAGIAWTAFRCQRRV